LRRGGEGETILSAFGELLDQRGTVRDRGKYSFCPSFVLIPDNAATTSVPCCLCCGVRKRGVSHNRVFMRSIEWLGNRVYRVGIGTLHGLKRVKMQNHICALHNFCAKRRIAHFRQI